MNTQYIRCLSFQSKNYYDGKHDGKKIGFLTYLEFSI